MTLTPHTIFDELSNAYPELGLTFDEQILSIQIPPNAVKEICLHLRDSEKFHFDYLMCLSGVDNGDGTLSAVYHLFSMSNLHKLTIKTTVVRDQPYVASVEKVWRTAEWHEREAYDLVGIFFEGHRDLRRILLPYDWEGYPLRKDYETPEFYQGMKVPY